MNMSQFYSSTDHFTIIPPLMLAFFGCAVLLFDFLIFPDPRQRKWLLIFVVLAEFFTGWGLYQQSAYLAANGMTELSGFQGSVTVDAFGIFFNWIFLAAATIVALVSYKYLEIAGEHHGEYYGLILFAQCGMYFLAEGTDLVTLFIGLELMALCFYVMVGFLRGEKRSNEAAIKYLLLGAFSTGFLVYGFSVRDGMAGSTKLEAIRAAINQTNIKRLLAYSSISHAGYMLLGLVAGKDRGITGIMVYVMVYTFMTLGAFLVVVALRRANIIGEDLDDIAGLVHKSPGYAFLMLIFLLSLAGIPPTAGFLGKYYIFLALIQTGHYTLAALAALYVAVAIYYYFKIVRSMFIREESEITPALATTAGLRFALGVAGVLTLAIGLYPEPFLKLAQTTFR